MNDEKLHSVKSPAKTTELKSYLTQNMNEFIK